MGWGEIRLECWQVKRRLIHQILTSSKTNLECTHSTSKGHTARAPSPHHYAKSESHSSISPNQHQHMQPPTYIKTQRTGSTPPTQEHTLNKTGKLPNSYQIFSSITMVDRKCIPNLYLMFTFTHIVDRKYYTTTLPKQKTNKSKHPPLLSPHTCVCGKRGDFDKANNLTSIEKNPIPTQD